MAEVRTAEGRHGPCHRAPGTCGQGDPAAAGAAGDEEGINAGVEFLD